MDHLYPSQQCCIDFGIISNRPPANADAEDSCEASHLDEESAVGVLALVRSPIEFYSTVK